MASPVKDKENISGSSLGKSFFTAHHEQSGNVSTKSSIHIEFKYGSMAFQSLRSKIKTGVDSCNILSS